MKSFKDFRTSLSEEQLDEALITFGGVAYPKFGQVLIMAGGAGSGKGHIQSQLVGLEGRTLDVDALKELAINSKDFAAKVKRETGHDLKSFDLKVPENVSRIHEIVGGMYRLPNKQQQALFSSILVADESRKPNIIFDITLKGMKKLEEIARNVQEIGYKKENIHIVWVVNDFKVAIEQNKGRSRVVPEEILMDTHEGVALTMRKILSMGSDVSKYMDGDIVLAFNKAKVDSKFVTRDEVVSDTSKLGLKKLQGKKGSYTASANYFYVKRKGKQQIGIDKMPEMVYDKIKEYVPEIKAW